MRHLSFTEAAAAAAAAFTQISAQQTGAVKAASQIIVTEAANYLTQQIGEADASPLSRTLSTEMEETSSRTL